MKLATTSRNCLTPLKVLPAGYFKKNASRIVKTLAVIAAPAVTSPPASAAQPKNARARPMVSPDQLRFLPFVVPTLAAAAGFAARGVS